MFRSAYFAYQHYRPEVQFGMCVMRVASPSPFKIVDETANDGVAENATSYMRELYNQISSSAGHAIDTIICDGSSSQQGAKCVRSGKGSSGGVAVADGSMDVYKVILLNITEKWLRSIKLLRPLMVSISSVDLKMVGHYLSSVMDRNFELLSNLFMPGLYGCAQRYMNKLMWRTLESWIWFI